MSEIDTMCGTCKTLPCICERPETGVFGGQAKRDLETIPTYRLIPYKPLRRVALRYAHGCVKYGERNWESGDPVHWSKDCMDRALEHLSRYNSGDRTEDHMAAAVWNLFAVMHFEEELPQCPTTEQTKTASDVVYASSVNT